MSRLLPALIPVALAIACGSNQSTHVQQWDAAAARPGDAPVLSVPDNPADREIRRHLLRAISHDEGLKSRDISFIVANGDVSVTGTVRTEQERTKINELAMGIGGVKSVANGLLITE
jgi:osmotically-inducible protein OsmY